MERPPVLNVANAVTVARILCTAPLVLLVLATPEGSIAAALAFGALAATDAVDGHLARSRGLVTTVGKLLDPLADKLLVGGALLALVATDRLALAVAVVILAREAAVSALRQVAYGRGVVLAAAQLGKAKMALQVALVLVLLATGAPDAAWQQALVIATVVITLASGLAYLPALLRPRPAPAPASLRP
jgi:CDP-diacylglycerol---glycerol-3-phosphate 3-phosphatidyltransferase